MEDSIACLYPFGEDEDGYAHRAVQLPANNLRSLAAKKHLPDPPGRGSRESTAPLDGSQDENTATRGVRNGQGLQLTFTHRPKAGPGFMLGTDRNSCDIVLPPLPRISRRHCYLAFDAERRLILQDCSTYGTIVKYDGKGGQKRRHFTWIIGGHEVPENTDEIVIQLDIDLKLQIVVSKPSFSDLYLENVDDFLHDSASIGLPVGALGIQSTASTAAASGTHTPNQDPILLEQETLGIGSFSTVTRVWDVSTGFEYASKRFHSLWRSDWKKEASLMHQISHEHMVRLHFVTEIPHPQLILEYLPLGSLEQLHCTQNLSMDEVISTLVQGLSALDYLHDQMPPIVHRDIKPENLLVRSRTPFHIKLGDFGLSKASEDLQTLCGTLTYLAPEVARYYRSSSPLDLKYTRAVDVWSLGVVVSQYAYELPHPGSGAGVRWCKSIVTRLNNREGDGLVDILLRMVVIEPQRRHSAKECLKSALELDCPSPLSTPNPSSYTSFRIRGPQACSTSPTVKMSTRELNELRDGRSKRQRSPVGSFEEYRRSVKAFPPVLSVSCVSLLRVLAAIQRGDGNCGGPDTDTSVEVDVLRQHCDRLQIFQLKVHTDDATERTIVTAISQAREFTLANFTSSDCANSVADLAQCLSNIMQLMSLDTAKSPNSNANQPGSLGNRGTGGSRSATSIEAASAQEHTGGSKLTVGKSNDTNDRKSANKTDSRPPDVSTHSSSTVSSRTYPVTFPSMLLDDTNVSGCGHSTPHPSMHRPNPHRLSHCG